MTEIVDSNKLIELVIEKHKKLFDTYNSEFSDMNSKLNAIKQQSDAIKKEIETTETRIQVLNEKYHLLFHQAKKMREDISGALLEKMRAAKAANIQDTITHGNKLDEFEKRLQNSKNIEDEERIIVEIKKLFYELESAARKAGITVSFNTVIDKLNEGNTSHKELLALENKPKLYADSAKDQGRQMEEIEGRHNWLKHRIESHSNALAYWEKQKGGIKID